MKFIKSLVIMSGENNKGTLNFEKNAYGVFVKFSAYGAVLPLCNLIIEVDGKKHFHAVSSNAESFVLKEQDSLNSVRAAVFCGSKLIMSGANGSKPTDSEIMSLQSFCLRHSKPSISSLPDNAAIFTNRKQLLTPSDNRQLESSPVKEVQEQKEEIKMQVEDTKYDDEALAQENYYENVRIESKIEAEEVRLYKELPSNQEYTYLLRQASMLKANLKPRSSQQDLSPKVDNNLHEDYYPRSASSPEKPSLTKREIKFENLNSSVKREIKPDNLNASAKRELMPESLKNAMPKREIMPEIIKRSQDGQFFEGEPISRVAAIKEDAHIPARESTFYEREGDEIEKLFEKGEREKELERILPGSKWVKIEYGEGRYYVVGIIGKEYMCYGLPATFSPTPPEELEGYCWWLPLNPSNPQGKGYWVMYQNLTSGDSVFPSKK